MSAVSAAVIVVRLSVTMVWVCCVSSISAVSMMFWFVVLRWTYGVARSLMVVVSSWISGMMGLLVDMVSRLSVVASTLRVRQVCMILLVVCCGMRFVCLFVVVSVVLMLSIVCS